MFSFADSFDLYATSADAINGYWDSGTTAGLTLGTGRFTGSKAINMTVGTGFTKSSGTNDAVHHLVISIEQTTALSGTTNVSWLELFDGTTAQCTIVFKSNGDIVLASGGPTGTVLDTYTGAVAAANTWYAFEIEVVINNSAGSWAVRKNGNTSNDHSLGSLDTQNSVNAYANKLQLGCNSNSFSQWLDDLFWRSDASSVAWLGDIRCYTRMPASDASVQFSRTPTSNTQSPVTVSTTGAITLGVGRYTAFTASYDGAVGAAAVSLGTGYTGNLKCSIFASSGTAPTTVLGSATVVVNPATGSNAITFGTPVAVSKGTTYYIGFDSDTSSGTWSVASGTTGLTSTTAYASFPAASPTTSAAAAIVCSLTITLGGNYAAVDEPQEDATTSYVYDSTAGDVDFYGIASIASTPATTIAVTTRGYMQKSDSGSRTAAVQIKSGGTTVASSTVTLTSTGWQWAWRMDLTDPNTSTAWTPSGVNSATIGPKTVA